VGGTDGSWAGGLASKATTAATPRGSHYEQTLRVLGKSKKTITSIKDLAIEIQNEMEELHARKTVVRPDYFSRSDNYSKFKQLIN
jgi:hypothetical protein